MNTKLLSLLILSILLGCKRQEAAGIEIGENLYAHQGLIENNELRSLIEQALKKDSQALAELIYFPCGGAAGCYDLGAVLVEIVYRVGEEDFIAMVRNLPQNHKTQISSLLRVGLEYGNFGPESKNNIKKLEDEFPRLNEELNK